MIKYNWQNYNLKSNKLAKKIVNFNKKHKFNFIEEHIYNHIRDIFCLVLTLSRKGKKTNVLDYGSNILSLSNIKNKIITQNFNFFSYNPYKKKNTKEVKESTNNKKKPVDLKAKKIEKKVEEDDLKHKKITPELKQQIIKSRCDNSLTQKQLAQKCNLPLQIINDIETGKAIYNHVHINKIKRILKIQ